MSNFSESDKILNTFIKTNCPYRRNFIVSLALIFSPYKDFVLIAEDEKSQKIRVKDTMKFFVDECIENLARHLPKFDL